jgi:hypothetical protein
LSIAWDGFFSLKFCYNNGMKIRSTLLISFLVVALIGLLHGIGIFFQLYWRISWYDTVVHMLSGFWAAWVVLLFTYRNSSRHSVYRTLILSLIIALSIGIVWEFFEFYAGVTSLKDSFFWADTAGDLSADLMGGIIGALIISMKYRLWNNLASR